MESPGVHSYGSPEPGLLRVVSDGVPKKKKSELVRLLEESIRIAKTADDVLAAFDIYRARQEQSEDSLGNSLREMDGLYDYTSLDDPDDIPPPTGDGYWDD